jgi:hypothetical protein
MRCLPSMAHVGPKEPQDGVLDARSFAAALLGTCAGHVLRRWELCAHLEEEGGRQCREACDRDGEQPDRKGSSIRAPLRLFSPPGAWRARGRDTWGGVPGGLHVDPVGAGGRVGSGRPAMAGDGGLSGGQSGMPRRRCALASALVCRLAGLLSSDELPRAPGTSPAVEGVP